MNRHETQYASVCFSAMAHVIATSITTTSPSFRKKWCHRAASPSAWISVLIFTVLLSCVGTGLFCGAITVARESRRAPLLAPAEAATAPLADGLLSAAPPLGVR